jgi:hypothetical protein
MGNVGSLHFQWNLTARVVVQRPSPGPVSIRWRVQVLWKSLRNHPGQGSDKWPKVTDLKSESVTGFIPES